MLSLSRYVSFTGGKGAGLGRRGQRWRTGRREGSNLSQAVFRIQGCYGDRWERDPASVKQTSGGGRGGGSWVLSRFERWTESAAVATGRAWCKTEGVRHFLGGWVRMPGFQVRHTPVPILGASLCSCVTLRHQRDV